MLKNYLKIAFRNILRNKVYSFLNIAGLAIGMAACIMILLWVTNQLSYNKFNKNLDRIFVIPQTQHYQTIGDFTVLRTPMPLAQTLKDEYPEVEYSTRYESFFGNQVLGRDNKFFNETVNFADSSFFKIFSFKFIEGNPNTALTAPNSIVITKETASKFFGKVNPIGRELIMDGKADLKITGVIDDVPKNSDLQFDGIVPTDLLKTYGIDFSSWNNNMIITYVLLRDSKQAGELSKKIAGLLLKHDNDPTTGKLFLFPFKDFHLYSYTGKGGRIEDVILFSIVAFFILIIACINFVNMATARSARRATEVGVKKVIGATRFQIGKQFLGESIILTLMSLSFGMVIVEVMIPYFNTMAGSFLKIGEMGLASVLSILSVTLLTGILSGIYPSIFLSSLSPATALKTKKLPTTGKFFLRRILVLLQFTISIALIISTTVVYLQMKYVFNKDIGVDTKNVVYFGLTPSLEKSVNIPKNDLRSDPNILSASSSRDLPIMVGSNGSGWSWQGMPAGQTSLVSFTYGDYDYLQTFDIGLKKGRFFSRDHPADSQAVVINESFAKLIGNRFALGMDLKSGDTPFKVVGVVNDFNYLPLNRRIGPLVIFYRDQSRLMSVKVNGANLPSTLSFIERACKSIDPGFVFDYHFLDKTFKERYTSQQRLAKIFGAFAVLAIIIACLGLFGLSSFAAEARTKEVGVRKVLGASVSGITYLLSRELIALVLIGNVVAWPVAYYFMNKWLQTFAYRIGMSVWIFIFAAAIALLIAAATTSYQSIKAATANPVRALRYE
ncbi:MAG: ABC transporter permease [Nitrososphaerota archaeon]|nr:ABC transporter permease [Nitrososphaerota archaeon]